MVFLPAPVRLCVALQGLTTLHSDEAAPASEYPCCFPGISPGPLALHAWALLGFPGGAGGQRRAAFPIIGQDAEP